MPPAHKQVSWTPWSFDFIFNYNRIAHSHSLFCPAAFILPKGYPDSVTSDYLPYQLWAVPSHIFGWLSVSLATSSLLKALGASPGAAGVAASAAAIKWITKDGIGAGGKLLVRSAAVRTLCMVCTSELGRHMWLLMLNAQILQAWSTNRCSAPVQQTTAHCVQSQPSELRSVLSTDRRQIWRHL